jgi:hypothetical protein
MAIKKSMDKKNNLLLYGGIVTLGFVITIGAVMFGRSDHGVIDVSAAIANTNVERKERGEATVPTGVQANPNAPNGGLVGKGKSAAPTPEPQVESAASSTEADTGNGTALNEEGASIDESAQAEVEDNGGEE